MDHFDGSNQQAANPNEEVQPMINGFTNYIYGAMGPFSNDKRMCIDQSDVIVEGVRYDVGARAICKDGYGNQWIIVTKTDTNCGAMGPFDLSQVVFDDSGVGILLDGNKVENMGLESLLCFDISDSSAWIICIATDSNEGQCFHVPAIPTGTNVPEVEGDLSHASEPGIIDQSLAVSNLQAIQPTSYTGVLVGYGADHQVLIVPTPDEFEVAAQMETEHEGLTPPIVASGLETQGDQEAVAPWLETEAGVSGDEFEGLTPPVESHGLQDMQGVHSGLEEETHPGAREFQSAGPIQYEGDTSEYTMDLESMLELESDEVQQTGPHLGPHSVVDVDDPETLLGDHAVLVQETHSGAGESQSVGPIQDEVDMSFEDFYSLVESETVPQTGSHSVDSAAHDAADRGEPIVPISHGAVGYWTEMLFLEDEELAPTMHDNGGGTPQGDDDAVLEQPRPLSPGVSPWLSSTDVSSSEGESPRKRARIAEELVLSPNSVLEAARNGGGDSEAPIVPTSHKLAAPVVMVSESNDDEGLAMPGLALPGLGLDLPVHGNVVQTPHTDSGECLREYSSSEIAGEVAGGTVATNSRGRQPATRKRPRHSKKKFLRHGVTQRAGGRKSFVAYFRPKDLPESDKKFLTIGEFTNEKDAWDAFNLFALIHEGEEACINADIESISMDAVVWEDCPRVDLLAHLRLKGREYFKSDKFPPGSEIPRYRNVKHSKNSQGPNGGKIRWFCDVTLGKGVAPDPNVANGSKESSTYDTPQEAAKQADRLMIQREGYMAWTNYSLTDYMSDSVKEQWDKTWIPLQDNPKKYLSSVKR